MSYVCPAASPSAQRGGAKGLVLSQRRIVIVLLLASLSWILSSHFQTKLRIISTTTTTTSTAKIRKDASQINGFQSSLSSPSSTLDMVKESNSFKAERQEEEKEDLLDSITTPYEHDVMTTPRSPQRLNQPEPAPQEKVSPLPTRPQIAWLLSFPNSGTSYTMANTQHLTGRLIATNYAQELKDRAVSLNATTGHGPFYKKQQVNTSTIPLPLPTTYILTKTHCAGYCSFCKPSGYILPTVQDFERGCRRVTMPQTPMPAFSSIAEEEARQAHQTKESLPNHKTKSKKIMAHYDAPGAARAIHLIRHPLDNLVSRMHLDLHSVRSRRPELHAIAQLPTERQRLLAWCHLTDTIHAHALETKTDGLLPNATRQLLLWKNQTTNETLSFPQALPLSSAAESSTTTSTMTSTIPFCRVELFRYVQWHSRVLELSEQLYPDMPLHTVHYESYSTQYNATVDGILEFLHQSRQGPHTEPLPFVPHKTYVGDLYTLDERRALWAYLVALADTTATPKLWTVVLQPYLGDVPSLLSSSS